MERYCPSAPSVIVETPTYDRGAHPSFVLPTRMGYRWRHFNHRVAAWKFGLLRDGDGHPWADRLQTRSVGGPFSNDLLRDERPELKFGYQRIDVDSVERIGAARRRLDVLLDSPGAHRVDERFDREELDLSGYRQVVAVLTGFGFETDVPQPVSYPNAYRPGHGYLTRGLGARVQVSEVDERSIELSVWLRYGIGAAMDRPHHNEALLEARIGAEIDFALIGVTDVPVHRAGVSYETEYSEPKIAVGAPLESIPDRLKRVQLDGTASAPAGFVGIQGFNFELTPSTSCRWNRDWPLGDHLRGDDRGHPEYGAPGYYLRELTVDLERERFDPDSGRAAFLFDGFASNSTFSIPFHPLNSEFSGEMVWIQAPGERRDVEFASEFPTGTALFGLDQME